MKEIRLKILSPQSVAVDEMVDKVSLPGTMGPFVILRNHAPIISSLEKGVVRYSIDSQIRSFALKSGFAEVRDNVVTVCAEI